MLNYNVYYRPPLSRNRYGFVNEAGTIIGGNSSIYNNGSNAVGGSMVTVEELSEFLGATDDYNGVKGIVPAPLAGHQTDFLQATGGWVDIPAYRYIKRWPFDEGLPERGVGVDGDFHVSDTLSTMNLNVEGQAHFWELVIDKAKANGGQVIVSPSLFEIDFLGDVIIYDINRWKNEYPDIITARPDIWKFIQHWSFNKFRCRRVWMKNDDGVDRTFSEVEVGDMMRCQTVNVEGHSSYNNTVMKDVGNVSYWTFVCGTGKGQFIDNNGITQDALYIDLVFAMTSESGAYPYVPIDTLFCQNCVHEEGGGWKVHIPDNYVMPYKYDDLKAATFDVLCGSTSVTPELIEDEDTVDNITELDFKIRGISYIVAGILGLEYTDDNIASLYEMLSSATLGTDVLFGSDTDQMSTAINKILGTNSTVYKDLMIYEYDYAENITDNILNGNEDENFQYSEAGTTEPNFQSEGINPADQIEWKFGWGKFEPRVGHHLTCMGHLWDTNRQNAVILSSIQTIDSELVSPSIAQYTGINIFGASVSQFRLNVIAKNGNIFAGRFMVRNDGSYIEVTDMINLFITDIETGLEAVGIHLNGANSTITTKGSVELHQHSDGNNDTLSVWDSDERKKVEIIPTSIPAMNALSNETTSNFKSSTKSYYQRVTGDYISEKRSGKKWHNPFTYYYNYEYKLDSYFVSTSGSFYLNSMKKDETIDIKNFKLYVNLSAAYFYAEEKYDLLFNGATPGIFMLWVKDAAGNNVKTMTNAVTPPDGTTTWTYSIDTILDDTVLSSLPRNGKFKIEYLISFYVKTGYTSWRSTRYGEGAQVYDIYLSHYAECTTTVSTPSESMMTIGTNGMYYSVGNGDYFYSGDTGFAMKYGNNGISFDDNWGCKLYKAPQVITSNTGDKRIRSELVLCKPASGSYTVTLGANTIKTGQVITIFGANGIKISSDTDRRFKIYNRDVNNYQQYNYIMFSNTFSANTTGANPYVEFNNSKVEIVALEDGYYILSSLYSQ